jgi:hypothetical protein
MQGDFAAQVHCMSALPAEPQPALGGLLLWQDDSTFLRLIWGNRGPREVALEGVHEGRSLILGRGLLPAVATGAGLVLRLGRRGSQVQALCSLDTVHWFCVGTCEFPATDTVEVGLHAVGWIDRTIYQGAHPAGGAVTFSSFKLFAPAKV